MDASIADIGDLSTASDVTAVVEANDTDVSTLDTDVTVIDLAGYTGIITNVAQAALTIDTSADDDAVGGANGTGTYIVVDTATALDAYADTDGATSVTATTADGDDLTSLTLTNTDTINVADATTVTVDLGQEAKLNTNTSGTYNIVDTATLLDAYAGSAITVTATTTNGQDLTTLDLSNVDTINVADGESVTSTVEQSAILDTNTSGTYSVSDDMASYQVAFDAGTDYSDISLDVTDAANIAELGNVADMTTGNVTLDTLELTGQDLDLANLSLVEENLTLTNIDAETDDIANTITLTTADVLSLGDNLYINVEAQDTLSVDGDIDLTDGITGWTTGADSDVNGVTYTAYTNDATGEILNINNDDTVVAP